MDTSPDRASIAFSGTTLVASGPLSHVAVAAHRQLAAHPHSSVLVLDAQTSEPIELDLRGDEDAVLARLGVDTTVVGARRSPGRPRLGVVAREVTLLPRHWEWLAAQPGGASVTLRKLVEAARKDGGDAQRLRDGRDSLYRFLLSVAGNEPGFEAATRALYAGDRDGFVAIVSDWPRGVCDHALSLAGAAFDEVAS